MVSVSLLLEYGRTAGNAVLDVLYPRRCMACEHWMPRGEPGFLCAECYQTIEFITNPCPRCGSETGPYSKNTPRCVTCRSVPLRFDSARAVGKYSTPLKELIHSLKYSRERAAALPLAEILLEALNNSPAAEFAEVVVPVPLHRSRLRKRTFNQSALIGKLLAGKLQLPFSQALARARPTQSQTELSHNARRKNVKDAFAIRRPGAVKGRQILLVDDVITSGATASECAKVLKAADASRVYAAAIAR
jgi:ComF family protein